MPNYAPAPNRRPRFPLGAAMLKTRTLRIGAAICAVLAGFMFWMALLGGSFPDRELVITRKYVSGTQFRIYGESLKPGFAYDTTVSRGFYDTAQAGDHLHSPLGRYLRLVRDGRTIKRYFSDDFVFPASYTLAALAPLVVFSKPETFPFRSVVWPIVGILEGVIVGMTIIGLFMPC